MQMFHDKFHIKDAGKIDKLIVARCDTGLRPGDSRYPAKCDNCYRAVGTVQRKHTSVEQGEARAPDNARPGEKWIAWSMVATPPFATNGGVNATSSW